MAAKSQECGRKICCCSGTTLRIFHIVHPRCKETYKKRALELVRAAEAFPGNQGAQALDYVNENKLNEMIFSFKTEDQARKWLDSRRIGDLLKIMSEELQKNEEVTIHGVGYQNSSNAQPSGKPVSWKQWLITTAVIWPLTIVVPFVLQPVIELFPLLGLWGVRHGLTAAVIVFLMVYVIMPVVIRTVYQWLYEKS